MPAPLVLLHGFTQTGASWERVRAALPPGRRVTAPDLRGHGEAADTRPVTATAVFGDLDPLTRGAIVAGYSMGGRIALAYALSRPGRLQRLVLIGASPGIADPEERRARRTQDELLARRIEERGVEAFAQEWARLPLFAGQPAAVATSAHAQRLGQSASGLAAALRGLGTGALEPVWGRLGELTIPVTLVVGERDVKFTALARRMAGELPRARVLVIPDAGHAVHLEAPDAVASALAG